MIVSAKSSNSGSVQAKFFFLVFSCLFLISGYLRDRWSCRPFTVSEVNKHLSHLCFLWCSSVTSPLQYRLCVPTHLLFMLVNPYLHLNVMTFTWCLFFICFTRPLSVTSTWSQWGQLQGLLGLGYSKHILSFSVVEPDVSLVKSLE